MERKPVTINREYELMMLVMLVGGMRSNPHKHKQAIDSTQLVTEANEDLQACLKRCNITVREPEEFENH